MTPEEKARLMAEMNALDPGPPPTQDAMATPDAYVQQPGQAQWEVSRDAGIAQRKRSLEEVAMDKEIQGNQEAAAREQMNREAAHSGLLAPGSENLKPGEYGAPPAADSGSTFEDRMGRLSGMLGKMSAQTAPRDTRYVSSPAGAKKNIREADNSRVYAALTNSDYEYKDPAAPGAGDGTFNGPMADELSSIPGVVAPGPDGMDRVDTGRLTMANASETGKLRREMDELRSQISALGDDPDAVLAAVNREAPAKRKAPRAGDAEVAIGDISVEGDPEFGGDWSTLESAGREEQDWMMREMRGRRKQAARDEWNEYRNQGVFRAHGLPDRKPHEFLVSEDHNGEKLRFKKDVSPYDTEYNRNPPVMIPQSDAEQSALLRQQFAEVRKERPADDFDSRNRADTLAQANSIGAYGTGPERDTAVDEWLAGNGISGPVSRESAAQIARQMNYDPQSRRLISNIQPGEILEAMRRRTELAL